MRESVHAAGHHYVGQQQVDLPAMLSEDGLRLAGTAGGQDTVAALAQCGLGHGADVFLVFDNQDGLGGLTRADLGGLADG